MSWAPIAGAAVADYELTRADVGATVRVLVTATNPDGSASRASAATAVVQAAPPANTAVPTVTGAALRATTLSASTGTWTSAGNTYAYQWQRDLGTGYVDIQGATALTYVLGVTDVGARIRIRVTAANPDATVSATSLGSAVVAAGPPLAQRPPVVSGVTRRTAVLSATLGDWLGIDNAYGFQWQRRVPGAPSFAAIPGATSASYVLDSADVGAELRVLVTATSADGSAAAASAATAAIEAAPPRNLTLPAVSGEPKLAALLTAVRGEWTPAAPSTRTSGSATASTSRARRSPPTGSPRRRQRRTVRVKVTAATSTAARRGLGGRRAIPRAAGEHRACRRADRRRRGVAC